MNDPTAAVPDPVDLAAEQSLLVRVGAAMTIAGDSIDEVGTRLSRIATARGVPELSVVVLPTALFVQTGHGEHAHVQLQAYPNERARLDQIGALYEIFDRAEQRSVGAAEAVAEIDRILREPPAIGALVRTVGLGVLSVGFSLSLQPTPLDMAMAFVLGILVGILRLLEWPGFQAVLPVVAAFVVATIVFATAETFETGNPIRTLIPPILTFLPGAVLTTGMRDLSSGQIISGSSRLVHGVVTLALLSFGILAAATLVGTPATDLVDRPLSRLGPWAPWVGLVLVAVGTHLHHCAARRSVPWILAILVVAYSGQSLGAAVFSAELSPFFGALAMTVAVLWLERLRMGPPSLVVFLPAFWLLVPGAAGLISTTEVATSEVPLDGDLIDTLSAVVAIALGVLIGTAMFRAGQAGIDGAVRTIPPQLARTGKRFDLPRRWPRRSSIPDDADHDGTPHDSK
jgi:uncharacterized membrane protein YjjP (DUF1212 family)